jgi:GntR family transcriptional regulator, galactonate operon transcriptional repressor
MTSNPFHQAAPRRKRNLFTHIVDVLGSRIVRGDWKPGEALPNEADLGRELGASRSILREAVKSLASKGLIEPRPSTGTRVLPPDHWNLLDLDVLGWRYATMPRAQFFRELFEIRRMIEPAAAALAAERATAEEIAALARACERMDIEDENDAEAIDADMRFHRLVLTSGHNDLLVQMGGIISVGLMTSFRIRPDSYRIFIPMHRQVFEAIRDRQPDQARAAMDHLLLSTREFLERELAEQAA